MKKGSKFIHQLVRVVQKDEERRTDNQSLSGLVNNTQTLVPLQPEENRELKVKKKQKNFMNRIYRLYPTLQQSHNFKLFGFLGINEKAIQNPDSSQSLLFSHFQTRVIERIEFFDYAILIEMAEPIIPFYQPSLDYIIEKYRSKGDYRYWQLSCMIQEVAQLFKKAEKKAKFEEKVESTKKILDSLGNQMYICALSSRRFAISKSLLTYLAYDLTEFSIEALKYKTIFTEFFSAIDYSILINHILSTLKYTAIMNLQQISMAQFKQLTSFTYDGFLQSKNHVRTYCNMTILLIGPAFLCHKVNQIYYKQPKPITKKQANPNMVLTIQEEKERIKQKQYNIINKIKPLPRYAKVKQQFICFLQRGSKTRTQVVKALITKMNTNDNLYCFQIHFHSNFFGFIVANKQYITILMKQCLIQQQFYRILCFFNTIRDKKIDDLSYYGNGFFENKQNLKLYFLIVVCYHFQ